MGILSPLKSWLKGFAAPAEDPRLAFADASQRHRELMGKVRRAREKLAASKTDLETQLTEARSRQQRLETGESEDPFAMQLRQIAKEELQTLEAEVKVLEREEKELATVEERLSVQEKAFAARQETLAARHSAAEARVSIQQELGGVSEELADLGVALEEAEQRTDDVQARASTIGHLADLGALVGGQPFGDPAGRQLASRFASEAAIEESAPLKRLLGFGFKALMELESEYRQLQAVLNRRKETDPLSVAYVPALAEETYRQGLGVLQDGVTLVQAIRSPGKEALEERIREQEEEVRAFEQEGTDEAQVRIRLREEAIASTREQLELVQRQQLRVDELLHQCGQCVSALNRSRIEMAALKVEGARTSVDAITASLRKTIDQAKQVQEELKRLGL